MITGFKNKNTKNPPQFWKNEQLQSGWSFRIPRIGTCKPPAPPSELLAWLTNKAYPPMACQRGSDMLRRFAVALVLLLSAIPAAVHGADRDDVAALLKQIKAVGKEGAGSPAARAAWDRLVERGPVMLPDILEAMDTSDTAVVNWLRTAFDRIVDRALQDGGKKIDIKTLRAYVENPKKPGRARRLALEVVERLQPGATRRLAGGWLDDPEFRYEAVELALEDGDGLAKQGKKDQALARYRDVFAASRDVQQVRAAAVRLKDAGVQVSVARHLGFLTDWYVIGPFDARGMKGF